jgi:uncharacterized protein
MVDKEKFRELLDQSYQWPDYYDFKFIVKIEEKQELLSKLKGLTISENPSKNGNYVAITARKLINATQEVLDVYEVVSTVKGIMSL